MSYWTWAFIVSEIVLTITFCTLSSEAAGPRADLIFEDYQDRVVQIRILEASSGSKATVGSGFVISPDGKILTNYHVIALLIHKPKQYRAEIVHSDKYTSPLTLHGFDAIHDLALVSTDRAQASYFELETQTLKKGTRIYAMGNPGDLGTTIVEGTHSGLLDNSLYKKIHFTGSLNGGMSGGPTVNGFGKVIGINVSSAGNQMSFLVPTTFAKDLIEKSITRPLIESPSMLLQLRDQLLQHQDHYLNQVLSEKWAETTLGEYQIPHMIASFVKCWGSSDERKTLLYATVTQSCSFEDGIFISQSHQSGTLQYLSTFYTSKELNRFRFYSLYQDRFQNSLEEGVNEWFDEEEEVGEFHCVDNFVRDTGPNMKVVWCIREYKHLPGLYDSVLKFATLDHNHWGLQSVLTITGVSLENAQSFGKKFLSSISSTS